MVQKNLKFKKIDSQQVKKLLEQPKKINLTKEEMIEEYYSDVADSILDSII